MSCYCGEKTCPQCNPEAKKRFRKKKEESPLAGVAKTLKNMTPEEIVTLMKKSAREREKWREEEKRKRNEPPKSPTGICVVCNGEVKGEYERRWRDDGRIGGPPQPSYWHFLGYHCTKCGLTYKFLPPNDVVMVYGLKP